MINMKQCLALVGLVGLVGLVCLMGADLYKQKPPLATRKSHFTTPVLTYARMDIPYPATNSGFLDDINISFDPPVKTHDPDPYQASINFQSDLPSGSPDKLLPRLGDTTEPTLTVADRKLNYELFGSKDFALKLNLEPAYPYPEALMPTRLDPGFGISIKF
ncbi:MAG: hypothetical protein ABSF60_07985 [Verrucomicrobiota bacterium]|jgi:hypothetical protein